MRHGALLLAVTLLWGGCDPRGAGRDASTPAGPKVAEVSVRIDAPAGGNPSVSVLAFRAQLTGQVPDVLGVVDPLVAAPPEGRCELRDVAAAARTLRARGGAVELEALGSVSLDLGGSVLRPAPRVYPQLAAVVGGVVGEAGPSDVASLPETITLLFGEGERAPLALRGVPRLLDGEGQPLAAGARLDPTSDLMLRVEGPHAFVEVRPYGAAQALACPVGPGGRVTVPGERLAELLASSGRMPISVEAVWRDSQLVATGAQPTRVSVEARSSVVLELGP